MGSGGGGGRGVAAHAAIATDKNIENAANEILEFMMRRKIRAEETIFIFSQKLRESQAARCAKDRAICAGGRALRGSARLIFPDRGAARYAAPIRGLFSPARCSVCDAPDR